MAAPELNEDVIAEILLRLPLDEPAQLVRASLVCKPWFRIVSDHAFLCRYRRFHRTEPPSYANPGSVSSWLCALVKV
ncbi:unnamed protein product [Urochloa humidicola]